MRESKSFLKRLISNPDFSRLLILILMFALTAVLQRNFFAKRAIVRNIDSFTPLILMTMGQAVVIISGGLDLSVGPALSLMTCVLTSVMREGVPITGLYALVVTFAVAMAIGVVNGIGIGYLRIPPVIVTFATSFIWLGIALFLRPTPGGETVDWFQAFYRIRNIEAAPAFLKEFGETIPPSLILVLIGCLMWWIISRTRTGRYIHAVGGNIEAARLSGVPVKSVIVFVYVVSSLAAGLGGCIQTSQLNAGAPNIGVMYELYVIAAVVVGGTSLSGGSGRILGTLIGAFIISVIQNGMNLLGIESYKQQVVLGAVILVAVLLDKARGAGRMPAFFLRRKNEDVN